LIRQLLVLNGANGVNGSGRHRWMFSN